MFIWIETDVSTWLIVYLFTSLSLVFKHLYPLVISYK